MSLRGFRDPWDAIAYLVRFSPHHILVLDFLQASRVHSMLAVQYLVLFATRDLHPLGVGHNHVVAAISLK